MASAQLQSRAAFSVSLGPPLFWLAAFFLVPLGIVWLYSFGHNANLTDVAITGTLSNYARAVEPLYLAILFKSLWFAALTTLLCLVIGFPMALGIAFTKARLKLWLLIAIMLPFWTNMLIRTYALMAVLRPFDLLHSNFAVMFGLVYVELPFMVLPLYATLDRMDRSLLEASLDLGAGHFTTFRRVVIPLAMPGILSGILITFIPSLGSYLTPDLLGGPDSQMIANVIEGQFKEANNWPFGAALSFLLMYLTFFAIAARSALTRKRPV